MASAAAKRRKNKRSLSPKDALQKLAKTSATPRHIRRLFQEMFRSRNDRGAAILLGTYLEDSLGRALEKVFHIRDRQHYQKLFGINSPLGTFSNKIRIAFALDLIGPETISNLETIREIRNAFAHSKIHVSFKTKEIVAVCNQLVIPKDIAPYQYIAHTDTPRRKFEAVCYITAKNLDFGQSGFKTNLTPLDPQKWALYHIPSQMPFAIVKDQDVILKRKPLP